MGPEELVIGLLTILVSYEHVYIAADRIMVGCNGTRFYVRTFAGWELASRLTGDTRAVVIIPGH